MLLFVQNYLRQAPPQKFMFIRNLSKQDFHPEVTN
jgi:hypothetical protein